MTDKILMLSDSEAELRLEKVLCQMKEAGIQSMLVRNFANIYYLTGRVFDGYVYISADLAPVYFVRRPTHLHGDNVVQVHKPENMAAHVAPGAGFALELDSLGFSAVERLRKAFSVGDVLNCSGILRNARAVKTAEEVSAIRSDGMKHERVYDLIPAMYRDGMTDVELQIEIERALRIEGSLGQFRIAGDSMELFMGNLLAGDNADNPSPYDFAMGGEGAGPSLPVGANGSVIRPGMTVMVDMNGNFNGYMTDMTRTFALGKISAQALDAHQVSIDICRTLAGMARPGMLAKELYEAAYNVAASAGFEEYFMGHRQKAGFVGHGVGIEVNELPVISPRSRDILCAGNVIALEPKFVIPGTGAVGVENTYVLTEDHGLEALTQAPEHIIYFS